MKLGYLTEKSKCIPTKECGTNEARGKIHLQETDITVPAAI